MFQLPWSNFHELNLDWIMQKLKELDEKVDSIIGSSTPSNTPPEMDGTASPGTSANYSRGNHVHPTDTSRASASGLTQEITDRSDADIALSGRIDTLDARVVPSDAYPLMDGTAESGSHVQYSRRDHRHPTDTSRAAQTDLQAEINDRINDVHTLQGDINAVDAKINFSSAAPLMDSSSASSGSSTVMARADHVHPTDTSRASATDVATLQARMDAFAGSANPSDLTPLMDGVGTAGDVGAYSRGNHQHPSDTSKLSVSGGSMTGRLVEELKEQYINTNAIGWLRIADFPDTPGNVAKITISKQGLVTPSEIHTVILTMNDTGPSFIGEESSGDVLYINKIRYSNAGKIDIHMDQAYDSTIGVKIEALGSTDANTALIKALVISGVADAPAGETILLSYDFSETANVIPHAKISADSLTIGERIAFKEFVVSGNGSTSLSMDNKQRAIVALSGATNTTKELLLACCNSSGVVTYTQINNSTGFTYSVDPNELIITNTTANAVDGIAIYF